MSFKEIQMQLLILPPPYFRDYIEYNRNIWRLSGL